MNTLRKGPLAAGPPSDHRRAPSRAGGYVTELDPAERIAFFRDVLGPVAKSIPFGVTFIRVADQVDLKDPVAAADGRAVLGLHPVT